VLGKAKLVVAAVELFREAVLKKYLELSPSARPAATAAAAGAAASSSALPDSSSTGSEITHDKAKPHKKKKQKNKAVPWQTFRSSAVAGLQSNAAAQTQLTIMGGWVAVLKTWARDPAVLEAEEARLQASLSSLHNASSFSLTMPSMEHEVFEFAPPTGPRPLEVLDVLGQLSTLTSRMLSVDLDALKRQLEGINSSPSDRHSSAIGASLRQCEILRSELINLTDPSSATDLDKLCARYSKLAGLPAHLRDPSDVAHAALSYVHELRRNMAWARDSEPAHDSNQHLRHMTTGLEALELLLLSEESASQESLPGPTPLSSSPPVSDAVHYPQSVPADRDIAHLFQFYIRLVREWQICVVVRQPNPLKPQEAVRQAMDKFRAVMQVWQYYTDIQAEVWKCIQLFPWPQDAYCVAWHSDFRGRELLKLRLLRLPSTSSPTQRVFLGRPHPKGDAASAIERSQHSGLGALVWSGELSSHSSSIDWNKQYAILARVSGTISNMHNEHSAFISCCGGMSVFFRPADCSQYKASDASNVFATFPTDAPVTFFLGWNDRGLIARHVLVGEAALEKEHREHPDVPIFNDGTFLPGQDEGLEFEGVITQVGFKHMPPPGAKPSDRKHVGKRGEGAGIIDYPFQDLDRQVIFFPLDLSQQLRSAAEQDPGLLMHKYVRFTLLDLQHDPRVTARKGNFQAAANITLNLNPADVLLKRFSAASSGDGGSSSSSSSSSQAE